MLGGKGNAPITTYFPLAQAPRRTLTLSVKTASDPMATVAHVRQRLSRLNRDVPLAKIRPMTDVVDDLYWMPRTLMRVFTVFGGFALVLAAAGVYGVLAYSVNRRTREIGIRSALGATQGQVAGLVVRQGLLPTLAGIAIGLGASFAATRLLRGLLAGVSPTDPWSFGLTTVVLLGGGAGGVLPAGPARPSRRSARGAALRVADRVAGAPRHRRSTIRPDLPNSLRPAPPNPLWGNVDASVPVQPPCATISGPPSARFARHRRSPSSP